MATPDRPGLAYLKEMVARNEADPTGEHLPGDLEPRDSRDWPLAPGVPGWVWSDGRP